MTQPLVNVRQNLPALPSVWLAEGQSSQRDMLASLQQLKQTYKASPFKVLASHRYDRPEILELADKAFSEPDCDTVVDMTQSTFTPSLSIPSLSIPSLSIPSLSIPSLSIPSQSVPYRNDPLKPRWQFVLELTIENQTKVLLTGRNSIDYEAHRQNFEQAGIRLLTGSTSVDMLSKIDDKFAFIGHCQAHNIPVATGWRFDNVQALKMLLAEHGDQPLCVKPVTGIFAQGFWRLDTGKDANERYDSFEHLYFTDMRKISTSQFLSAYKNSVMVQARPIPMLLMPYLEGREYSIDVVCENGEVLSAITRYKVGKVQYIGYDESVMEVVIALIRAFDCDGIVSVQTKEASTGQHRVLEINSRPSGGIGYTNHSGIDLTQIGFGYWLGLTDKPNVLEVAKQIKPCQVRSIMTSVKIS